MRTQAPVVVIGGGMVGCSALYHLTRMGWTDLVLLDLDDGDIDPARSPRCWPRVRALPVPRPAGPPWSRPSPCTIGTTAGCAAEIAPPRSRAGLDRAVIG